MRELTRINDRMWEDLFTFPSFKGSNTMKCDIAKKDGNYIIDLDLPGFSKENIELSLEDGYLTVAVHETSTTEDTNKNYIHKERYTTTTRRSFYVGSTIKEEDIKASYHNGTLTLSLPEEKKVEEVSRKYITIE